MNNSTRKAVPFTAVSRPLILGTLLAFAPSALHAAPMMAESSFLLVVTTQGRVSIRGDGTTQFSVPAEVTLADGSNWKGVATAETGLIGDRTFVSATARNFSMGITDEHGRVNGTGGEASVLAVLDYEVLMVRIAPPPVPLAFVPTTVNVRRSVVVDAVGDPANNAAVATVGGSIGGTGIDFLSVNTVGGPRDDTVNEDLDVFFSPGQPIKVRLFANASSHSGINTDGPTFTRASASAFIDPVFSFDQEAFDELARAQGFTPFDLAAFFAFEQSPFSTPGLPGVPPPGSPVAEPGSLALVFAGGLFLGAMLFAVRRVPSVHTPPTSIV